MLLDNKNKNISKKKQTEKPKNKMNTFFLHTNDSFYMNVCKNIKKNRQSMKKLF